MFILDSLMISGIRWALETAVTAAEAEMNDDSILREQLLEAEMRREMGEISDDEFQETEADLLARIREIKERREGAGPLEFSGAQPLEAASGETFHVEASVSGDFHEPAAAPHTTVLEVAPVHGALGNLVQTRGFEQIAVLDMQPGDAAPPADPPPDRTGRPGRVKRSARSKRSKHSAVSPRSGGDSRKRAARVSSKRTTRARTARSSRTSRTTRPPGSRK